MSKDDTGLMEQEIINEENTKIVPPPVQQQNQKSQTTKIQPQKIFSAFKNILISSRKPKLVTLILLFIMILVVYFALILLSQRQKEIPQVPSLTTQNFSPKTSQNPQVSNLNAQISAFNSKLDALDNYQKKLSLPSTELDISFEK